MRDPSAVSSAWVLTWITLSALACEGRRSPMPVCIPVLGFGFNDDTQKFVPRLLSSIDFCIDHLVIVLPERIRLDALRTTGLIDSNVSFVRLRHQFIGVAETWNAILNYTDAPWYMICAYDVLFLPGQLETFSRRFWARSGSALNGSVVSANFAHTRWLNMPGGRGFNLFGMSRNVVQHVGYFDENIYPAFWEDRDYLYRLKLWGGARVRTFADIRPIHGLFADENGAEYNATVIACLVRNIKLTEKLNCADNIIKSIKYISGTKYISSKEHKGLISSGDKANFLYATSKWGCDVVLSRLFYDLRNCTFDTPFNSGKSISFWKRRNN